MMVGMANEQVVDGHEVEGTSISERRWLSVSKPRRGLLFSCVTFPRMFNVHH